MGPADLTMRLLQREKAEGRAVLLASGETGVGAMSEPQCWVHGRDGERREAVRVQSNGVM